MFQLEVTMAYNSIAPAAAPEKEEKPKGGKDKKPETKKEPKKEEKKEEKPEEKQDDALAGGIDIFGGEM